jgi:carboxyl-terminal processing protease
VVTLNSAVTLASEFIPEGVMVEQKGRYESQTFNVNKRGRLIGMPTVVLMNGGSASASEILAGALRDRLDVPLVGEKSFGKVQFKRLLI